MAHRMTVVLIAAVLSLACTDSQAGTAEENKAKGDKILREMSDAVAGMQTFSFTAVATGVALGTMMARPPAASTALVLGGSPYSYYDDPYYQQVVYGGGVQ